MSKPIWFPFYPGDFLSSSRVAMMTTEEIGGYLLLLCHCWQDPACTIPSDDDAVRKLSRLTGSLDAVKSCFILKRGRLLNERLYKEWKKVKEKSELAKKSVEVRWKNTRNTNVKRTLYSSHRNIGTEEQKNKGTEEESELHSEVRIQKKELTIRDEPSAPALVWESYANAYQRRYGTPPVRNAKVNSQIAQFVKRVPGEAAPTIAAFYVTHSDAYYVRMQHPVGLLLRDAEGLHTQWKNGQRMTATKAQQQDKQASKGDMWREIIHELAEEKAHERDRQGTSGHFGSSGAGVVEGDGQDRRKKAGSIFD